MSEIVVKEHANHQGECCKCFVLLVLRASSTASVASASYCECYKQVIKDCASHQVSARTCSEVLRCILVICMTMTAVIECDSRGSKNGSL